MTGINLDGITPVLFPLEPIQGESLRGYMGRVAEHNAYARPSDLITSHGLRLRQLWSGEVETKILAKIYGVSANLLDPMVPKSIEGHELLTSVYGIEAEPHTLRKTQCPISPSGLRRSAHHRFSWSWRRLPFCSEDWSLLVDNCPNEQCRAELKWHNGPLYECAACRFDLRQAQGSYIDPQDRPLLSIVADLTSWDPAVRRSAAVHLPDFIAGLAPENVLSVALAIGASLTHAGHQLAELPERPAGYPQTMLVGMRFLLSGAMNGSEAGMPIASAKVITRARNNLCWRAREASEPVWQALQEARRRTRLFGRASTISVSAAANATGLGRTTIRWLIDQGVLLAYPSGGGKHRRQSDIDAASLEKLKAITGSRISISRLSSISKLPAGVIEHIFRNRGINQNNDENVLKIYASPQYPRTESLDCLNEIGRSVNRIGTSLNRRIHLSDVFGADQCIDALWAEALLATNIPGGIESLAHSGLEPANLTVSHEGAEMIRAGGLAAGLPSEPQEGPMTLTEAEVRLKTNPKDIQRLIKLGLLSRKGMGVCRRSVSTCLHRLISSRELAERAGCQAIDIGSVASEHGMMRPYWGLGFWQREEAEALFPGASNFDDQRVAA